MPEIREEVMGLSRRDAYDVYVAMTLRTTSSDPFAFSIDFYDGKDEPTTWTMALALLQAAFEHRNRVIGGEGDVTFNRIPPVHGAISMSLSSPNGDATILIPQQAVEKFLANVSKVITKEDAQAAMKGELEAFLASCE